MVSSCSAYGCKNRWNKEGNIQFHRFPLKNPELLQKWLIAVKRVSWKPSKASLLCGEHFTGDSYKSNNRHFLKDDAIPSLFNFPSHLQKTTKKRRLIEKHELIQVKKVCQAEENALLVSGPSTSAIFNESSSHDSSFKCSISDISITAEETLVASLNNETSPSVANVSSTHSNINLSGSSSLCFKNKSVSTSPTKKQLRRKIHNLQKKLQRREKKIKNLESLLNIAKKGGDMSDDTKSMLSEDLHESQMVRKIIELYLKIRLNSHGKSLTLLNVHKDKASVRQRLTKLILQKNV